MKNIKRFWVRGNKKHPASVVAALEKQGIAHHLDYYLYGEENHIFYGDCNHCHCAIIGEQEYDAITTNPNWKKLDGTDYSNCHDKETEYENIETVYHPDDFRDSLFELGLPLAGLEEEL